MSDGPTNCRDDDPIKRPQDWGRVVDAAAAIVVGASQEKAASVAGCSERAIRDWKACSWWPEAVEEAKETRLNEVTRFALNTVLDAMRSGEYPRLAWDILDRLESAVPAKEEKVDHTSSDGSMSPKSSVDLSTLSDKQIEALESIADTVDDG